MLKYKKKSNKKKILLLSDDMRLKSGVGTMSKEIIRGTVNEALVHFSSKSPKGEFVVVLEGAS